MVKCFECGKQTASKTGYCLEHRELKKHLQKKAVKMFGQKARQWSLRGLMENVNDKSNWIRFVKGKKYV